MFAVRAQGTMRKGFSVGSPKKSSPAATAGAAQYQKFLGMGVRGKRLFSKSPFPRKSHFPQEVGPTNDPYT